MRELARLGFRDLRGGLRALWLPIFCMAVAVSAHGAVAQLAAKIRREIFRETRASIGADIELTSSAPLDDGDWAKIAPLLPEGSRRTQVRELITMGRAEATGRSRILELRAVGDGFPFYGEFGTEPPGSFGKISDELPQVVAQPELGPQLGISTGDRLFIGTREFQLAAWVRQEPGAATSPFLLGPKVWIHERHLPSTGLDKKGSRIRFRTQLLIPDKGIDELRELQKGMSEKLGQDSPLRINVFEDANPQLKQFYGRLMIFLNLISILVFLLSGVGVLAGVRNHLRERRTTVAILRCLGASRLQVQAVFTLQLVALGALGSAIGVATGLALRGMLPGLLSSLLRTSETVDPIDWSAAALSFGLGCVATISFGQITLAELPSFKPLSLLRSLEATGSVAARNLRLRRLGWTFASLAFFLAVLAVSLRSLENAALLLGTTLGIAGLIWLLCFASTRLLARFRPGPRALFEFRYGLGNLGRDSLESASGATVLAMAVALLSSLAFIRSAIVRELGSEQGRARPALFLIDIASDQKDSLTQLLAKQSAGSSTWAKWVKGTLAQVNGEPFRPRGETGPRSREMNVSERLEFYSTEQPVEGQLWTSPLPEGAEAELSVETGFAERADLKLGDLLSFEIQGVELPARITSLRRVKWSEFQPNFFLLFRKGSLEGAPHTWIASIEIKDPGAKAALQSELVEKFPNVTAIDIADASDRIVRTAEKLGGVLGFLSLFGLLSGAGIIAMISLESARRREREIAILKTLGASRSQTLATQGVEFFALGAIAAALGGAGGYGLVALPVSRIFQIQTPPFDLTIGLGLIAVSVAIAGLAVMSAGRVFGVKPSGVLK